MSCRRIAAALCALVAVLASSGCVVSKEDIFGPETGWKNLTSNQLMILEEMSTPGTTQDAGITALTEKDYSPVEVRQLGDQYRLVFVACGDKHVVDCRDRVRPTDELPYAVLDLSGEPTDSEIAFAGQSYLLYPAGRKHNEHYAIRCDLTERASDLPATGISPASVADMHELGGKVAAKVAPIRVNGDYPVTHLTIGSNTYGCVLDYDPVAALA